MNWNIGSTSTLEQNSFSTFYLQAAFALFEVYFFNILNFLLEIGIFFLYMLLIWIDLENLSYISYSLNDSNALSVDSLFFLGRQLYHLQIMIILSSPSYV